MQPNFFKKSCSYHLDSPGDRQVMAGLYAVYEQGQTRYQIGDNRNLFDWTYVGNVARAHLLAADKLDTPPPAIPLTQLEKLPLTPEEVPPLTQAEQELVHYPLRPITVSTGNHRVPTHEARPLGPYVTPLPNAKEIEAAFNGPNDAFSKRPVVRTRFDALSDSGIVKAKLHNPETTPLQVAGQVFFITNGEPCYFWDFPRFVWHQLDAYFPGYRTPKPITVLSKPIGVAAAVGSEWYSWLVGKEPTFTKFKVSYSCATRWHNIEKARRVLGYEPEVGLEQGVKRMVDVSYFTFLWIYVDRNFYSGGTRSISPGDIRRPIDDGKDIDDLAKVLLPEFGSIYSSYTLHVFIALCLRIYPSTLLEKA